MRAEGPKLVSVPDGMTFLLRPIHAGFASLESIHRTDLDLNDFADANAYLDAVDENSIRTQSWIAEQKSRRK